jgi:hypothetical protein
MATASGDAAATSANSPSTVARGTGCCTSTTPSPTGGVMRVLYGELSALYKTYKIGEESRLAPATVQYADFAAWQCAWLAGPVLEAQVVYWRVLDGAPGAVLPADAAKEPTLLRVTSACNMLQRVETACDIVQPFSSFLGCLKRSMAWPSIQWKKSQRPLA